MLTLRHALPSRALLVSFLLVGLAGISFAQNDIAAPNGSAGYVRMPVAAVDGSVDDFSRADRRTGHSEHARKPDTDRDGDA